MIRMFFLVYLISASAMSSDTVRVPLKALPENLELDKLINVDQTRVASMLVDGLIEIGENLKFNPRLMKSSRWKNNNKVLEITIGEHFYSDGSVISSQQFIRSLTDCIKRSKKLPLTSFRKILGYEEFISGKSKKLKGLKVVNKNTMEFETTEYEPRIIDNLHHVTCSAIKSGGGSYDLLKGAIGSGPYKLKSKGSDSLVLEKRDKFSGKISGPKRIVFSANKDFGNYQKMKDRFDLIELKDDPGPTPGFNRYESSTLATYQLGFNNSKKPFNSEPLRKAVALAIDYKLLASEMGWAPSRMQAGLFPYGMKGFVKRDLSVRRHEEANKILKSLGYSKSKPFSFTILTSRRKNVEKEVKFWSQLFSNAYIKAEMKLLPHKDFVARKDSGDFEVIRYSKYAGSIEPDLLLGSYLTTSTYNTPRSQQKNCDKKINIAVGQNNKSIRDDLFTQAARCLIKHQVIVPLASHGAGLVLVRKPWKLRRSNQYMLYSYFINEWVKDE